MWFEVPVYAGNLGSFGLGIGRELFWKMDSCKEKEGENDPALPGM
jgi:hypothetical protein